MSDSNTQAPLSSGPSAQPQRPQFNFWRWFWLSFLVVSLAWAWYDFYAPSNNVIWAKDYASAQRQAVQSGKPMILFLTGKWCVPCRIMKRTVWADKQVESTVNASFTPLMIDVDDPSAAEVLSRYRFGATPTTIITDPQGKILQQVQGGIGKTDFLELLAKNTPSARPHSP